MVQKEIQKKSFSSEIIAFKLIALISPYDKESICDLWSVCSQTALRLQISPF